VRSLAAAARTLFLAGALGGASLPDPAPFDAVLASRARAGGFDYRAATGQDRKRLAAYLSNLGDADPKALATNERKAFYINAYNAIAIETLLENPGRRIIDLPGAFKTAKHRVGREEMTLDEVEDRLRREGDARIHFAIVCAARSCPPLAGAAYRAQGLSEALDRQARAFVNDGVRNVLDRARDRIALSMIFRWNRAEFEREAGTLDRYVARYAADPETARWLAESTKEPDFLEYDWSPNQP
jgi:hypothetical protein